MQQTKYDEVIKANIALHSKMADDYSTCEPHFRPENINKVEKKLKTIFEELKAERLLDLGCGTGFIINIAKKYVKQIDGVDVTQAMMDKVDKTGSAIINLYNHDTGSFPAKPSFYDVVTGYSFLHHLYDINPTLKTAYAALKPGENYIAILTRIIIIGKAFINLTGRAIMIPLLNVKSKWLLTKMKTLKKTLVYRKMFSTPQSLGKI